MIALVVTYVVREGQGDAVAEALRRMGPLVREHEPDCLSWQASRSQEDPTVFHLYEVYRDQAALDAHRQTPHFEELIVQQVRTHVVRRDADTCDVVV